MNKCIALAACTAALVVGHVQAAPVQKLTYIECRTAGVWLEPTTGATLNPRALVRRLASKKVVLLGERHAEKEHQLWQAHMLAALHAHQPNMVVGFEMFPRAVQPALDSWSRGELSKEEFLTEIRWQESWGYPVETYMPIFDFVRQTRITSRAINVDRRLISQVGQAGWAATSEDDRRGIGDPAPATEDYRAALANVFGEKMRRGVGHAGEAADKGTEIDTAAILKMPAFQNFVDAQLTWDRAMAEGLAKARDDRPGTLAIGIMGRGHAEFGYGVPHQLTDLGVNDVAVLLAVDAGEECETTPANVADAVFLVDPPAVDVAAAPERPRLGVMIETTEEGVRVLRVVDDSIAKTTGILAGDVIVSAAGTPITRNEELIEIIQRQAPGTWLPLAIRRADEDIDLVAKFPSSPAT